MAMNFLDQLLNLAGLKLPEGKERYDPSVYRQEVVKQDDRSTATEAIRVKKTTDKPRGAEELTGVARYMAKKQQQEHPEVAEEVQEATAPTDEALTGVAKYLARLEQEAREKAQAEATAWANMSSVERYLARLEGRKPPESADIEAATPKDKEQEPEAKPLTRVERYLSEQSVKALTPTATKNQKVVDTTPTVSKPTVTVEPAAPQKVVEANVATQSKPVEEKKHQPVQPIAKQAVVKEAKVDKPVDLTGKTEQCQAMTSRGVQCKNKTGLVVVEKAIDNRQYRFSVCKLHNTKAFKPFPAFIESR
ncbi:MAG: hypothetical protein Kow0065_21380 [Methylomicrobium sp.]